MLFKELVQINETALVADAVNFEMLSDEEKNLKLCQGYIFNYDDKLPKSSTVAILDCIRESYKSSNQDNIHLLVQDYGKGKSHFGLVIANFFKNSFDSPEVQGILNQIKIATQTHGSGIFEALKAYKERTKKYLVICLSGEKGDLKKLFLKAINQALEAEGITDSIAQHICKKPIEYLEQLNPEQISQANNFLASDELKIDVKALIDLLKQDDYQVIPKVIEISRQINGGFAIDFEADLDVEAILKDIITKHCSGSALESNTQETSRRFEGILILLDELNAYLQNWAHNPAAAGGMILQNITNACENNKGKIALMSFTQIKPSNSRAMPFGLEELKSYQKLTSRLELNPTTYEPISSLELVLSNLITQKEQTSSWSSFNQKFDSIIREDSKTAYEQYIPIYQERNWTFQDFHTYLGKKCFPLHPLTAYLLCNLDFTQGRTAIQFIKEEVKNFIAQEEVAINGYLNYIYPVNLVDAFDSNFSQVSHYKDYNKACNSIASTATKEEELVLKALFLFYASGSKLKTPQYQSNYPILGLLTGLSSKKIQQALESLLNNKRVIYQRPDKLYAFYSGTGLIDLETQIDQEVANEELQGKQFTAEKVVEHGNRYINQYLHKVNTIATQFVNHNKLRQQDWQFTSRFYTIVELYKLINSQNLPSNIENKGIIAHLIAENEEELNSVSKEINNLLKNSPLRYQLVVALPQIGINTNKLANVLQKLQKLQLKHSGEKTSEAFSQLHQYYEEQIQKGFQQILHTCSYQCMVIDKISVLEKNIPEAIISKLLEEYYPLVPPIKGNDKMALNSTSGSTIIGFASKQIFNDSLTPQVLVNDSYKSLIDDIYVEEWGLLHKSSQKYSLNIPVHPKIKVAWDEISKITDIGNQPEKTIQISQIWDILSQAPYGYNEYTFTILLTSWLAYHRREVVLSGNITLNAKAKEAKEKTRKPLQDWISTNILDKPKDFIHSWVIKYQGCIIRRLPPKLPEIPSEVTFEAAINLLEQIEEYLKSDDSATATQKEILDKKEKLQTQVESLEKWFKPVEEAEKLTDNAKLEELLQLSENLSQTYPDDTDATAPVKVILTQDMRDRASKAAQEITSKIQASVYTYSTTAKSLTTAENCRVYNLKLDDTIVQVKKIPSTPRHILEALESCKQQISEQQQVLTEQETIEQCLSQIKTLSDGLSTNATQTDYLRVLNQIETLQKKVPTINNTQDYQAIIHNIQHKQQQLNSLIETWQKRCETNLTLQEAQKLKDEIIHQKNRFTETSSEQAIFTLLATLEQKIDFLNQEENKKQKRNLAQEWLLTINKTRDDLNNLNPPREKLQIVNKLLGSLKTEKSIHLPLLNDSEKQQLEELEQICEQIQAEDKENQIIFMFNQLTREQKISLHNKLSELI